MNRLETSCSTSFWRLVATTKLRRAIMPAVNPWLIAAPTSVAALGGIVSYGAVSAGSQLFGSTVYRTSASNHLALTFDDGPNPSITPQLLDLLEKHQAVATFFVIGRYARECPNLLKEISARGHVVGNHTETHPNLFWLNPSQILVELRLCQMAIAGILGTPPKWFRPPFGIRNPWVAGIANDLNVRTATWTLLPGDWRAPNDDWLIRRMQPIASHKKSAPQSRAGTGDILCLHDGNHRTQNGDRSRTLAALEYWLPRWRDLGLEFVTIDQAAGSPAS
jgi:peptidoglycan-N-acetylglucosamine deacetylase